MSISTLQLPKKMSLASRYSSQPAAQLLQTRGVVLVISFDSECGPGDDPRHFQSALPSLDQPGMNEVWYTSSTIESGVDGNCHWSQSEEMLFVGLWLDEMPAEIQQQAVSSAYTELLGFALSRGYSEMVRSWNYLPDINAGEGDKEQYRQFCLGRQTALNQLGFSNDSYPAACALGHRSGRAMIYLLAGKQPVTCLENPRQISAYHYPRRYGPARPSIARASLAHWSTGDQF